MKRRFGLERREMERELQWALRSPPSDPKQLSQLFSKVLVDLISKNNAAIADALDERKDEED